MKKEIWSYEGQTGPNYWNQLVDNDDVYYDWQSPIILNKENLTNPVELKANLKFNYKLTDFEVHYFTYTIHLFPIDIENEVIFNGERFFLQDIHFHTPGEHIVNQHQCDIECHLVHENRKGQKLVIGTLFNVKSSAMIEEDDLVENQLIRLDPSDFLPQSKNFFHYVGSLTTPPTMGPVLWLVMDQQQVASSFLNYLVKNIPVGNSRPLQKGNGRPISYCSCH